jgi:hypothetical protein
MDRDELERLLDRLWTPCQLAYATEGASRDLGALPAHHRTEMTPIVLAALGQLAALGRADVEREGETLARGPALFRSEGTLPELEETCLKLYLDVPRSQWRTSEVQSGQTGQRFRAVIEPRPDERRILVWALGAKNPTLFKQRRPSVYASARSRLRAQGGR